MNIPIFVGSLSFTNIKSHSTTSVPVGTSPLAEDNPYLFHDQALFSKPDAPCMLHVWYT